MAPMVTIERPSSMIALWKTLDSGSSSKLENQPASFRDFFKHLDGNPGACTVSTKCYLPNQLVETW